MKQYSPPSLRKTLEAWNCYRVWVIWPFGPSATKWAKCPEGIKIISSHLEFPHSEARILMLACILRTKHEVYWRSETRLFRCRVSGLAPLAVRYFCLLSTPFFLWLCSINSEGSSNHFDLEVNIPNEMDPDIGVKGRHGRFDGRP
ncbi:uncharacterized protein [Lolium perenne]|uniref:uncharacterized protein n=1 Tax=Lolium perenne TaxID=4522 RepID=UPI003A9A44C2